MKSSLSQSRQQRSGIGTPTMTNTTAHQRAHPPKRMAPLPSTTVKMLVLTAALSMSCIPEGVDARRLAMLRRSKSPPLSATTLHGFPFIKDVPHLESSIFLYRGGSSSNSDNDELDVQSDDAQNLENNENSQEVDNEAEDNIDHRVETNDNIQVTSTVASSNTQDEAAAAATVETSTHNAPRKKSNAVGDPDGNSSDDDTSDDDLEELDELEKELMMLELERQRDLQQQGKEGVGDIGQGMAGFETLVEMAERMEVTKSRIADMERELARRRKEGEEEGEIDLDADGEEEEEEELDESADEAEDDLSDGSVDSSTSYHLTGTNVTKEDELLKRQRKYKRGSIFKHSTSGDGTKKRKSSNENSSPVEVKVPAIPTTIDSATLDNMLVSAFQSMIFLPPPSPRLPSLEGSTSLRNVDVSSRRRLDRRTLYHGLLAEMGGSHHHGKENKDGSSANKDGKNASASASKKDNSIDSMIRRRYLDVETSRSLKGALSLACQPQWRDKLLTTVGPTAAAGVRGGKPSQSSNKSTKDGSTKDDEEEEFDEQTMPSWWYRGGVCLFPSDDDENAMMMQGSSPQPPPQSFMAPQQGTGGMNGMGGMDGENGMGQGRFFGPGMNDDEAGGGGLTTPIKPWRCTMGMQETVAMALAHSLSCGLALIDDEALANVRGAVECSLAELASEAVAEAAKEDGEDEEAGESTPPTINPEELRNSALLGHLVRLSDEGKLGCINNKKVESDNASSYGTLSRRMTRDMELGLDDPNDDLAVESLRLMKEDERHWFEPISNDIENVKEEEGSVESESPGESSEADSDPETNNNASPLSLVLFLRSDSSPSILKSKSAVERLAHECVKKDGIHLLMLGGKGIDASTTSLPGSGGDQVGAANGRMSRQFNRQPSMMSNNQQGGGGAPFSFMSDFPPGSPEFHAQMQNKQQQQQQQHHHQGQFQHGQFQHPGFNQPGQPGGAHFTAQNANASGINDPEGSRRFNIFLARTVDPTGKPQIMGTIAPPDAGNLFPTILANMANENLRVIHEEGLDEEDEQKVMFVRQMEELASQAEQHLKNGEGGSGDGSNAAFFNATITSPFGSEILHHMNPNGENDNGENGMGEPQFNQFNPPPEQIQRAIQNAMSSVIDRLAQMSAATTSNANNNGNGSASNNKAAGAGGIPLNIARAFSQVLSNENLRRGISENLSKAAPALIDPRCQGVMLSVYVPPGPEHPNKGMMPGDQFNGKNGRKGQQQQQASNAQPSSQQQPPAEKGSENVPHGMGGWLNKILSSSDKGKHTTEDVEEATSSVAAAEESDDGVADVSKDAAKGSETEEKPAETKDTSIEQQDASPSNKPSKRSGKKSKRERNLDRARTLAVAAAALAGAKKGRKDNKSGVGGRQQQNVKLTPEQKAQRNLSRLQTLCRSIPLPLPIDPVRCRSWEAWSAREEGSVIFRKNRRALRSLLGQRNLSIDVKSGTKGAGIVLRQMMSAREIGTGEMEEMVRSAVETEAGKSQRHHESPWGVVKPTTAIVNKPSLATDKSLLNFLHDDDNDGTTTTGENTPMRGNTQFIHPNSLESALSLICGVSPSPGSHGSSSSSGSSAMASHRSKEDLLALAQDKHEKALIPNCVSPQDIGVTYDMIGGLGEVKELLRQSVTYPLKFPHLYSEGIAREAVKGVLLFGPPGTGKTMLAKAVATEGGASFLSVDASSVENKWLGESEKNAKAVFTLARRLAPCVIFIDEVDSLLSSREGSSDDSAHGTLTSVKTTMMSEWDGLNSGTNGKGDAGSDRVVVIGSTNRPFDLDEAVLRRFPRRILVDLPDLETRREILEVTLAENRLGGDVNLTLIAERLEGYTGSDLKEVCREAVVQISHEQARMLDRGEQLLDDSDDEEYLEITAGSGFQMLRPVTMQDFENAMRKLKRSVSETGRELAKVWDWNDEYGEIKKMSKKDALPQMMNMFL